MDGQKMAGKKLCCLWEIFVYLIAGYYADPDMGCQAYHVCLVDRGDQPRKVSFLCPNGTIFQQAILTCEWW